MQTCGALFFTFLWPISEHNKIAWNCSQKIQPHEIVQTQLEKSMAWNIAPSSSLPTAPPRIHGSERFPIKKPNAFVKPTSSGKSLSPCKVAQSEGLTEEQGLSGTVPSLQFHCERRNHVDIQSRTQNSQSKLKFYEKDACVILRSLNHKAIASRQRRSKYLVYSITK